MAAARLHARCSASAAHRWLACPASVRLAEEVAARYGQDDNTTIYAARGTYLHGVAETVLRRALGPDGVPLDTALAEAVTAGRQVELATSTGPVMYTVTDEDAALVRLYCETVHGRIVEATGKGDASWGIELSLDTLTTLDPDLGGTADAFVVDPATGMLSVFDLKTGHIHVDSYENMQLLLYATGVFLAVPEETKARIENIEIVVVQNGTIREPWRLAVEDLIEYLVPLGRAAERTRDPAEKPIPGEWCRYCPARGHCPALVEMHGDLARSFERTALVDLPPERIAQLLAMREPIMAFLDAVAARARVLLENGVPVPGFTLAPKRAYYKWADEALAPAALRGLGLSDSQIYERKLITPATARKLLKAQLPKPRRGEPAPDPIAELVVNTTAGQLDVVPLRGATGTTAQVDLPLLSFSTVDG